MPVALACRFDLLASDGEREKDGYGQCRHPIILRLLRVWPFASELGWHTPPRRRRVDCPVDFHDLALGFHVALFVRCHLFTSCGVVHDLCWDLRCTRLQSGAGTSLGFVASVVATCSHYKEHLAVAVFYCDAVCTPRPSQIHCLQ